MSHSDDGIHMLWLKNCQITCRDNRDPTRTIFDKSLRQRAFDPNSYVETQASAALSLQTVTGHTPCRATHVPSSPAQITYACRLRPRHQRQLPPGSKPEGARLDLSMFKHLVQCSHVLTCLLADRKLESTDGVSVRSRVISKKTFAARRQHGQQRSPLGLLP